MKKEFIGKTVCLLGDSIMEHGFYTYNLRAYFQGKEEKCFVFNRGVAGNRAIMAQYLLEDEVYFLNPDYVFICFGANDMGVWLYDSFKEVTPELLEKRKVRDDEYILAYEILIDKLLERGIMPVVMSPYAVNSFIKESDAVYTVPDNKEKEDILKPSFYKRKTFENINEGFKGYTKRLKDLAERKGVLFFDIFSKTYEKMLELEGKGMYFDDGCHYTKDFGHAVIARAFLEYFGVEDIPSTFPKTKENDEIFDLEQLERSTGYLLRCTPLNEHFGKKTEEEKLEYIKSCLNSTFEWGRLAAENYFKHAHEIPEMKKKLIELVKGL